MRKLSDEEIQKIVEGDLKNERLTASDAECFKTYSLLFHSLERKPSDALPSDFADKVVEKISYRNSILETLKFYVFILALILLFFSAALAIFIFAEVPFGQEVVSFISNHKEEIIFALTALLVVQMLDKLLVHNRLSKLG